MNLSELMHACAPSVFYDVKVRYPYALHTVLEKTTRNRGRLMIMGSATCHVVRSSCLSYRSVPHSKLPSLALSTLSSTPTTDLSLIVVLCADSLS